MVAINFHIPQKVLHALAGNVDDHYLAGGTALSISYFQHRESYDVDLFTKEFSLERVFHIIKDLEAACNAKAERGGEQLRDGAAKMLIYKIIFGDGSVCKVDFVEDLFDLLKPLRMIEGINVLSLEDIYLRKIYSVSGYVKSQSITGQDIMTGGRQEAKDLYDLYCLSHISMPLSAFATEYGDAAMRESLVRWFSTYDRMQMKMGLLDLKTSRQIDARLIEEHFEREVDKLLSDEIGI